MKKHRLHIRISQEVALRIESKAEQLNISKSEYVRSLIENKRVAIKYLPDDNADKLKQEIAVIGRNIWQLNKKKNRLGIEDNLNLIDSICSLSKSIEKINTYYDSKNK